MSGACSEGSTNERFIGQIHSENFPWASEHVPGKQSATPKILLPLFGPKYTHTNTQHNTKLSCSSNKQYTKYNPKGLCTLVNCTHFYAKKNKSQDKGRAVHESLVGGGQTSPCAPLGGGPAPTHHGSSQGKFIMSRKKILCKKSPEILEGVVGEGVVGPHPQ